MINNIILEFKYFMERVLEIVKSKNEGCSCMRSESDDGPRKEARFLILQFLSNGGNYLNEKIILLITKEI